MLPVPAISLCALLLAGSAGATSGSPAEVPGAKTIWQIGRFDGKPAEFAFGAKDA